MKSTYSNSQATAPLSERRCEGEEGFLLVAVIAMMAILLIGLAVAAPIIAKQVQRDKEVESEHRAEQYVRAIRLFYRKTKTYPASLDALENTNNTRFLRQKYKDPLTGKEYRLIPVGQNKTQVSVAFGEPLSGLAGGGLGSAAGLASTPGTAATPNTTVNSTNALNSGFGGATIGGSAATPGTTGSTDSTDPLSGSIGPIMGVGSQDTGDSILNPNQQTTYETWEFLYDPRIELLYQQANIMGGGGIGSTSATGLGNNGANGLTGANGLNGTPGTTGAPGTTNASGSNNGSGNAAGSNNPDQPQ